MPIIELTGSGDNRMTEIQSRWIVSEAGDYRLYQNPLYTVPIGQTYGADVVINSGSVPFESGTFMVKKDIHVFQSESDVENFLNNIGTENISSISKKSETLPDGSVQTLTEIQLVNHPQAKFSFDLLNSQLEYGFKIEIFASGANGLYEIEKSAIFNARGDLISDTFLKYFEIEVDTE